MHNLMKRALMGVLLFLAAFTATAEASKLKTITVGSARSAAATVGAFTYSPTFTLAAGAATDTSATIRLDQLNWFDNPTAVTTTARAWLVLTTATAMDSCSLGYLVSMDGISWAVGVANANATVKSTLSYSGTSGWAAIPFAPDIDAAATAANPIMFPFIKITSAGDANSTYLKCQYKLVISTDPSTP